MLVKMFALVWSFAVRMYQPRKAIRDGNWTFSAVEPAT